jgi:TPP-dependent pyruvate/acetoin dehydrogenase alpha subunit
VITVIPIVVGTPAMTGTPRFVEVEMGSPTGFDPARSFRLMVRMRLVDEALVQAWADGLVPGEYHSGIGEEGINAGVLAHLGGPDSMALDHRNTAPLVGRGTDLKAIMLEVMGSEAGLNRGWAGHMHLMDPDLSAAADGMVGASGPLAAGQAIAHTLLRPGQVSVAFHGEAAMNQGMLMESYNLAVAWKLPVLFVCKDNKWSITTHSADVTGGDVVARARAFGLAVETARGDRVQDVHRAAGRLIGKARHGEGPGFLHVSCHRPGGHFEGDPIVRLLKNPRGQAVEWGPPMIRSAREKTGGRTSDRVAAAKVLTSRGARAARDYTVRVRMDPVRRARALLESDVADRIEEAERREVDQAITEARAALPARPTFGRPGTVTR